MPAQTAKVLQQQPQQTTQRIVQQNENNLPPVTVLQTQAGQSGQAVQGMGLKFLAISRVLRIFFLKVIYYICYMSFESIK